MSARTVLTTDTLETFRTTFNSLSQTDIGDPATLTTTATSVVGAINEINSTVTATGFSIADDTSTVTQTIVAGDVFRISSGSNITASVSSTDTLTVALNSSISGLSSISSTEITGGVVKLLSNTIKTTDSTPLSLQEVISVSNTGAITGVSNLTGSGTVNFLTDVQKNGVSLATSSFAIAQAVALG